MILRTPARLSALAVCLSLSAPALGGPRSLEDYRYFRALTVDLKGRVPTLAELAAFERADFDRGAWVEEHLRSPGYVDRISRVYMDALRLEVNPLVVYTPAPATLVAETIKDDTGALVRVWWRKGQRRVSETVDGDFCLSHGESGVDTSKARRDPETLPRVSTAALERATVKVKPWWLYRDYPTAAPRERLDDGWIPPPTFRPTKELLFEPDGKTPAAVVRVCREEAQTKERGTLWVSPRAGARKPPPLPVGRVSRFPYEDVYANKHKGEPVSCSTNLALTASVDCGCGVGLERCLPQITDYAPTFLLPAREPVGLGGALPAGPQQLSHWQRWWWRAEAMAIMSHVLSQDLDVRELVRGRFSYVNGPLSQFYRFVEPASCCSNERNLGMLTETEPLFLPERVPSLLPHEVDLWTFVPDRGPHAAGLLTTAAYLGKYASRRARAAAVYTGLLCKNFLADTSAAPPTTEPNLMVRPGCASCHAALEPLAAYFTHVKDGAFGFLSLKTEDPQCKARSGKLPGFCPEFYDPAFSTAEAGVMRGAYGSKAHADGGPEALGAAVAASPDYLSCAVEQVASSFLGRPLTDDDEALRARLLARFTASGNRMRALVRALVLDPVYAESRLGPTAASRAPFVHPPLERKGDVP